MQNKPGWKTTEFGLSLLVVLFGLATASGVIGDTGIIAKIVALGVAATGALGYSFVRSVVKHKEGSKKPGWRTTEFWLSAATIGIAQLIAAGVITDGGTVAKIVALAVSVLGALGYTVGRGAVKLPGDPKPVTMVKPFFTDK